VDQNLQGPLKNLAEALHAAISQSSDVDKALREVRDNGFNALLVLEITVALSKLTLGGIDFSTAAARSGDEDAGEELSADEGSSADEDPAADDAAEIIECDEDADLQAEAAALAAEIAALPAEQAAVTEQAAVAGQLSEMPSPFAIAPDDREFLRSIRIRLD
jgi:hypothetical protein